MEVEKCVSVFTLNAQLNTLNLILSTTGIAVVEVYALN